MIEAPQNGTIPHAQEMKFAELRHDPPSITRYRCYRWGDAWVEGAGWRLASRWFKQSAQREGQFNALQELRSAKDIAQLRGITVHKVFNG